MRKRVLLAAALALAAGALPARAADTTGMSLVGSIPFTEGTHLEFLQRGGRTYALAGSRNSVVATNGGVHIVDVTAPETPVLVSYLPCAEHNNDPHASPDGTLLVLSLEDARGCTAPNPAPGWVARVRDIAVVDIADLANPRLLGSPPGLPAFRGAHTVVWHPTLNILYISNQETPDRGPQMGIVDFRTNPPTGRNVAMPPMGSGPHDTTFNAAGTRAYVAALTATYVLDTTDPMNPTLLTVLVDPTINIHHEAFLSPNGRYLLITDELAGAIAAPVCPGGGIHVYDLSVDERVPIPVGIFWASDTRLLPEPPDPAALPVCTSHEGGFSADGSMLSMAWYQGGTRVFDVAGLQAADVPPGAPVGFLVSEIAHYDRRPADTWASRFIPGSNTYVVANDTAFGLEIYRLD